MKRALVLMVRRLTLSVLHSTSGSAPLIIDYNGAPWIVGKVGQPRPLHPPPPRRLMT